MEILKLGKITSEELASWFNTSKKNFSNHKKRFLKELEKYCSFEPIYGGVNIKEITQYVYIKNPNYEIVLNNINEAWSPSGLDTCSHVSEILYEKCKDQLTIKKPSVARHTRQARDELWGIPKDEWQYGTQGTCYYVFCKKTEQGTYEYLNQEEEQIKEQLLMKWFGDAKEKTAIVQSMIENEEIKSEKAWDYYSRIMRLPKSYLGFMTEFKEKTGIQLVKGTQVIRDRRYYTGNAINS